MWQVAYVIPKLAVHTFFKDVSIQANIHNSNNREIMQRIFTVYSYLFPFRYVENLDFLGLGHAIKLISWFGSSGKL